MSAQWIDFWHGLNHWMPGMAFMAGLSGSLHCSGMCGGLVMASCETRQDGVRYQLGRLLAYLMTGLGAGFLGKLLLSPVLPSLLNLIFGILIGMSFIAWGFNVSLGRGIANFFSKQQHRVYVGFWNRLPGHASARSFGMGLATPLLPCGLLYGVALGTMVLNYYEQVLLTMFCFWLGNLPALLLAPHLAKKILSPLKQRVPRLFSFFLIALGCMTITYRIWHFHQKPIIDFSHQSAELCH